MCPIPCGKKRETAPLSTSVSGPPRRSPNSARPSAITRAAVRWTSRHSVPAVQLLVAA